MAGEKSKTAPLRDWVKNSYDETGRACSGLDGERESYNRQIPSLPDDRGAYDYSGSADPGRRNK